jgi:hypothetical protein
VFPYLYEGTTEEDYNSTLPVEKSNCSVTFSEFFTSKHNKDDDKIEWMKQELAGYKDQTESFTCELTADYVDIFKLHKKQNKVLWVKELNV